MARQIVCDKCGKILYDSKHDDYDECETYVFKQSSSIWLTNRKELNPGKWSDVYLCKKCKKKFLKWLKEK